MINSKVLKLTFYVKLNDKIYQTVSKCVSAEEIGILELFHFAKHQSL